MESAFQESALKRKGIACFIGRLALIFCFSCFIFNHSLFASNQIKLDSLEAEGLRLYKKAEFKAAIIVYQQYLQQADSNVAIEEVVNAMSNIANCYTNMGNYIEAVNIYLESIKIVEKLGPSERLGRSYNNLGTFYSETADFENALKYFSKSEELGIAFTDSMLLADVFNNKGLIYEQQNDLNRAKDYYEKALIIYLKSGDNERISLTYNNMGIALKYLKQYDAALKAYEKSIEYAQIIGNQYLAAANLINIGNLQLLRELPNSAIEYYSKGIEIALENETQAVVVEGYDGMASAYSMLQQYSKAYDYSRKYEGLKSQQINEDYKNTIAQLQTKFDTERQEQLITDLESQKRISTLELKQKGLQLQRRNLLLVASGVLVLLLVVSGYFVYQRNRQKMLFEQQIAIHQTELNERLRIAKDLHDELGAGLAKVSLIADISQNKMGIELDVQENLTAIASTSKELISSMRDLVWALNAKDLTLDSFVSRLRQYTNEYLDNFSIDYTFDFPIEFPNIILSKDAVRQLMLTYKEALTNAVKHAKAKQLTFYLKCENHLLQVSIADDGKGINPEQIRIGSNGLKNMENRIADIGGTLTVKSEINVGTTIDFQLPLVAVKSIV